MVHVLGVAKFVDHQVAQQFRVQKQQAVVDTDCSSAGMTAPASLLTPHMHFRESVIRQGRERIETWAELPFGNGCQPTLQGADAELVVACFAALGNDIVFAPKTNAFRVATSFVAHAKRLTNRMQFNPVWQDKWFRGEHFRKRRPRSLYPLTMFVDKGLHIPSTRASWHNDLNSTARKHLDRQSPGSFALAHRKARRIAGLFGV